MEIYLEIKCIAVEWNKSKQPQKYAQKYFSKIKMKIKHKLEALFRYNFILAIYVYKQEMSKMYYIRIYKREAK